MAVRGFFYNATDLNDKERRYNGQDMNEDKAPFYKEGVVYGHLQVTAGDGMEVRVDGGSRRGYAYINLHTIHNTAVLPLTISQASGTLPRIDRVIVRNDETERRPSIFIREGAFSSKPQPPGLINNDVIQEKSLARVYVRAGAVAITQADITDERADDSVCGFVASQFKELDFSQFLSQFNAWFTEEKKAMEKDHAAFVKEYTELIRDFMDGREADLEQFNAWIAKEKKAMEKDRLSFVEEYAGMTKDFMETQAAEWEKWFQGKQDELAGDVAGKLQLQIDGLRKKVHNMAFKLWIAYRLESIQEAVTVTLSNVTTGSIQTADFTESGIGFYITEAGEYTVRTNKWGVVATPNRFTVDNVDLMHTMTVSLRDGADRGYIGNYMGAYIQRQTVRIYIAYLLEGIQGAVTLTLTNTTTGRVQTAAVSESGVGFHIQEAGDYIMETDMEAVMPIPRTFSVGNVDHMPPGHTMTVSLRECANMAYIGNYIGTHILS